MLNTFGRLVSIELFLLTALVVLPRVTSEDDGEDTTSASITFDEETLMKTNESVREIQARLSNYNPEYNRGCGELPVHSKIVGGRKSFHWPWLVALRSVMKNGNGVEVSYKCGGVLVTDLHVLTAAHCVQNAVRVTVQLGHQLYFTKDDGDRKKKFFSAEQIFVHERYSFPSLVNDVALIKLNQKVPLDDNIWPICLPSVAALNLDDQIAIVAGWGKKKYGDYESSVELLEVEVPIRTQEICRKLEAPYPFNGETQICGGRDGKGFCQGDSGGPLMHQPAPGLWTVVGIVSSAYGCADVNRPGIYTRVTFYTDWIIKKMFL